MFHQTCNRVVASIIFPERLLKPFGFATSDTTYVPVRLSIFATYLSNGFLWRRYTFGYTGYILAKGPVDKAYLT